MKKDPQDVGLDIFLDDCDHPEGYTDEPVDCDHVHPAYFTPCVKPYLHTDTLHEDSNANTWWEA